jgi:prenyltransferase beta subunit
MECETDSGFTDVPGAANSTLEATFQAVYMLNSYNKLGNIDTDAVIDFVNSCRNEDHGYGDTPYVESDLYATFYGLWLADLLEVQFDNDTDEWIEGLYNETEGFSAKNGTARTLYATYFGLEAIYLNNTDLSAYNLSIWLLSRQNTNPVSEGYGGFATDGNSSNIWATWATMGSLTRLNVSGGYLVDPLVTWINQSQNLNDFEDDYGAFSSKPSENDFSLLHTYAALYSLQKVDDAYLSQVNLDAALDWLLDLQNVDGGFRVNSIDSDSSVSASYYAFCTFDLLGELNRLRSDVPWESGLELPIWLWVIIGALIAVIAILLIRKYYLY